MAKTGPRLNVTSGNAAGSTLTVEGELVLGRQAEGDGRLGGDEEISRFHARLSVDADGCLAIEDLGSTNGTFVNGLRITAPTALSEGDTVEVGGTTLLVEESAAPAPPLSFQLEVDFDAREALLKLDDASDPVRLVYDAGQWRVQT